MVRPNLGTRMNQNVVDNDAKFLFVSVATAVLILKTASLDHD